ncbi:heterokaryon incompatibility protein-domain-containing protein [Armillaria luteobubalina]|uniref:Heterokaryon incompatibility protein-domain-containing protein n=1 Tax=Armillaria luteobubalina TaxID=153913 RepID=A0AA39TKJ0_9AGAR|nr:heterokaryon incompatibility protein-domain-containing protein [Armillaria luteobubalina]
MEDVHPDIRKLVCETCWNTVFSVESFRIVWEAIPENHYSRSAGFSYTTPTWRQIQRQQRRHSIKFCHQCEWCRIVCELIETTRPRRRPPKDKMYQLMVRLERFFGVTTLNLTNGKEESHFPILTAEDDPAAKFIPDRDILLDVDSSFAYDLIKKRVLECFHHEHCSLPQYARLPTRVIDCLDPNQPRLFVSKGAKDHYVALSYVWGEGQPNRLKNENLDSYIVSIPSEKIPKTIMDAIIVTHKLGFRYLWVDSFCILQDSEDDKAREIAQIRHIFRNSYVTIIAACAHKVSDGFLHDRRRTVGKLNRGESMLPFRCPDGDIGTMRLVMGGSVDPIPEPVNKRAWCLEERALSPRRLIYATHTLVYECQTIHNNMNGAPNFVQLYPTEDIPRLPNRISPLPPTIPNSNLSADSDIAQAWYNVVTMYTQRTLTRPRDRLNALAGIAEQYHSYWPYSKYFAGLWEHQLPGSLLWGNHRRGNYRRRPDVCYAPSWSWASRDGEVEMGWCSTNNGMYCTVIHCNTTPAKKVNPTGQVEDGGILVLETVIQLATWSTDKDGIGDLFAVTGAPLDQCGSESGQSNVGLAFSDAIEKRRDVNVYIAFVGQNVKEQCACGLVLVPVTDQVANAQAYNYPVFRRVGSFRTPLYWSSFPETWLKSMRQCIMII